MNAPSSINLPMFKLPITLTLIILLVVGCSGTERVDTNDAGSSMNNSSDVPEGESDDSVNGVVGDIETSSETTEDLIQDDTDSSEPPFSDGESVGSDSSSAVVPDPLIQNLTRIDFEITVPAYQSDALQLRLDWDDGSIIASWVGDELWSASGEFPTNTETLLQVSFYDDHGEITLASYEQRFTTGSNALQIYTITADQFDIDRWDSDGDGISNLVELIAGTDAYESPRVLLFSETRGFRHDAIDDALQTLEELAQAVGMQTFHADDSEGVFTEAELARYDAVVWVMTSGDVLSSIEQAAFENFIRSGGGYAGIHSASDTEYDWPWYGALVGAYFDHHPIVQTAVQIVEDNSHVSTAHLNSSWIRTDEWYDYRANPRAQVNVLLRLDERSYSGGLMGDDHPSAWYHDFEGGRSWYTGGGHTSSSYSEPDFRTHLLGGLRYVARHQN